MIPDEVQVNSAIQLAVVNASKHGPDQFDFALPNTENAAAEVGKRAQKYRLRTEACVAIRFPGSPLLRFPGPVMM